jgi:hypothetical protein
MLPFTVRRALESALLFLALALCTAPATAQTSNPCAGVKCPLNAACHAIEAGHACVCNRGYFADPHQGELCLRDDSVPLPNAQLQQASTQAKTGMVVGFLGAGFMAASELAFWLMVIKAAADDRGPSQPLVTVYALHITGMALLTMGTPMTYRAQTRALEVSGTSASRTLRGFRIATWVLYSLSMASFALWFVPSVPFIAPIIGEVFTLATTTFGIIGWSIAGNIARKAIDDPQKASPVIAPAMVPLHGGMMLGVAGTF